MSERVESLDSDNECEKEKDTLREVSVVTTTHEGSGELG